MSSSDLFSFPSCINILSYLESSYSSQLFLSQYPYQTTKKQLFQKNLLISTEFRPSFLIGISDSNLSSNFLATLAIFRKRDNRDGSNGASSINSDKKSDISEAVPNQAFIKKDFESKSDSESNFDVAFESKNDDNNNNFIVTLLKNF